MMPEIVVMLVIILVVITPSIIKRNKKLVQTRFEEHYKDMLCSNGNISSETVLEPADSDNCISFHNEYCALLINNDTKQVVIGTDSKNICDFDNIMNVEIEIDDSLVASPSIGGAIVGGIFFGGVGAIVGSSKKTMNKKIKNVALKICVDDLKNPYHRVLFFSSDAAIASEHPLVVSALKEVSEWYSRFLNIIEKKKTVASASTNAAISVADELMKLSSLLNEGVITQDEFNAQKKKLLEL